MSILAQIIGLACLLFWGFWLCCKLRLPAGFAPLCGLCFCMVVLQLAGSCNGSSRRGISSWRTADLPGHRSRAATRQRPGINLLRCLMALYRRLIIGCGFPLDKTDRSGGAGRQTIT